MGEGGWEQSEGSVSPAQQSEGNNAFCFTTTSAKVYEILCINLCGVLMASKEKWDLEFKLIYEL